MAYGPTDTNLALVEADPAAPEAANLVAALDGDLRERYPGLSIHGLDCDEFRRTGGVFLMGWLDGSPVACGAIRPLGGEACEVKRMFVRQDYRGRGFARAMLAALERIATARGYRTIRLETGEYQPEAIALYQSAGYHPIPCYGEYAFDSRSRYFEKSLAPNQDAHRCVQPVCIQPIQENPK
jgi:GNAT superfamily N-acetyltransferase